LYFYGARFYDSQLGRFIQADTLIPDPGNVLDWDRYSYVRNNPLRYVDPSGHAAAPPMHDYYGSDSPIYQILQLRQQGYALATITNETVSLPAGYDPSTDFYVTRALEGYYPGVTDSDVQDLYRHFNFTQLAETGVGVEGLLVQFSADVGMSFGIAIPEFSRSIAEEQAMSKGGVYVIYNPNGVIVRVGQTNNLIRRKGDYRRDPNYFDLEFEPQFFSDDYATRRGLEQILFEEYHPPMNVNRPIGSRNPKGAGYFQAASNFLADKYNYK
jgi:hypothetical protein